MKVVKFTKSLSIADKRFDPVVGEHYEVIAENNGRPVITDGKHEVWSHKGEFEVVS